MFCAGRGASIKKGKCERKHSTTTLPRLPVPYSVAQQAHECAYKHATDVDVNVDDGGWEVSSRQASVGSSEQIGR